MSGKKFGRWLVLTVAGQQGSSRTYSWNCVCECGTTKVVNGQSLRTGHSKSCGCLVIDTNRTLNSLPPGEARRRAILQTYKQSAKERHHEWSLTTQQFDSLIFGKCYYCSSPPINGIDRLNNTIGYVTGNVVSCCKVCNYAKNVMSLDEFIQWIKKVAVNVKLAA